MKKEDIYIALAAILTIVVLVILIRSFIMTSRIIKDFEDLHKLLKQREKQLYAALGNVNAEKIYFKEGDKVLFKDEGNHYSCYKDYHTALGFDYYLIDRMVLHARRKNGISYRITLPDGGYVVHASPSNLIHYKPEAKTHSNEKNI